MRRIFGKVKFTLTYREKVGFSSLVLGAHAAKLVSRVKTRWILGCRKEIEDPTVVLTFVFTVFLQIATSYWATLKYPVCTRLCTARTGSANSPDFPARRSCRKAARASFSTDRRRRKKTKLKSIKLWNVKWSLSWRLFFTRKMVSVRCSFTLSDLRVARRPRFLLPSGDRKGARIATYPRLSIVYRALGRPPRMQHRKRTRFLRNRIGRWTCRGEWPSRTADSLFLLFPANRQQFLLRESGRTFSL